MNPAAVVASTSEAYFEEGNHSFLSDGSDIVIDHIGANCSYALAAEPLQRAGNYTLVSNQLRNDSEYTIVTRNVAAQPAYDIVNSQAVDGCEYRIVNEPLAINCDYTVISENNPEECSYYVQKSEISQDCTQMLQPDLINVFQMSEANQSFNESNSVIQVNNVNLNHTFDLLNEQNSANQKIEKFQNDCIYESVSSSGIILGENEKSMMLTNSVLQNNIHNTLVEVAFQNNDKINSYSLPRYKAVTHKVSPVYGKVISPTLYQPRRRSLIAAPLPPRHIYQNLPGPHLKVRRSSLQDSPGTRPPVYMNVPTSSPREGNLKPFANFAQSSNYGGNDAGMNKDSSLDDENGDAMKCDSTKGSPTYIQMTSPFVRSPVSSIYAQLATVLASYAGHSGKVMFCPLCPRQLSYERSLINHIQRTHRFDLEEMVNGEPGDLVLQSCPLCQASFFNTAVLPKHLFDCHKDGLIQLLEKNSCLKSTAEELQCPFCAKTVPADINGERMLVFHLQRFHNAQFSDMITNTFDPRVIAPHSMKRTALHPSNIHLLTPELYGKMGSLLKSSDSKRKLSDVQNEDLSLIRSAKKSSELSVEKKITRTPLSSMRPVPKKAGTNRSILRSGKKPGDRNRVKRELRFSVPHVTKQKVYFPDSSDAINMKRDDLLDVNECSISTQSFISTEDIVDMDQPVVRKRRRLHMNTNIFRCKDKENASEKLDVSNVHFTENTKVYRRPKVTLERQKPVTRQKHPSKGSPCATKLFSTSVNLSDTQDSIAESDISSLDGNPKQQNQSLLKDQSHLSSLKLYSQLRLFRCNTCNKKYCDNVSLMIHVSQNHRGLLSLLRAHFACGICPSKFYDNKQLVKHSLQHHTSLLEIRDGSSSTDCASKTRNNDLVTAL